MTPILTFKSFRRRIPKMSPVFELVEIRFSKKSLPYLSWWESDCQIPQPPSVKSENLTGNQNVAYFQFRTPQNNSGGGERAV